MRKNRSRLYRASVFILFVAVLIGIFYSQLGFNPTKLRRLKWYAITSPGFMKYCFVKNGTPRANVLSRFGEPEMIVIPGDPKWTKYITARNRAGWSQPPEIESDNIIIYEAVGGIDMIVVYYFLKEDKVIQTFISET